ncbi:DUF2497 domain-containing protein [Acetobacter thailandicus]|uniref:DUF2497 domain-containing protein n=1 Tax=Acetobacter thailandicus TaxID=1502842 RepID=UPI0031453E52
MTSSPSDETKTPIEDILASIRNKLKEERPEFLESPLLHTGLYEDEEDDLVLTPELTAEKEEDDLVLTPEPTAEKEEEDSAASLASVIREEFAKLSPEEAKPLNSEPTEKQTEELRLIDEAPPSIREILLQLYTEKASLSGLESKNTIENEAHEDRAHTSSNVDEHDHNIAQDYNVVRDDTGQNSFPENAVQENTASALSVSKPRNVSKGGEEEGDYGSLSIPLNVETIADTDSSFAILQKTLQEKYLHEHEERRVAVNNQGSLTIEDIVRQEVRVMLKKWLDANLAGIVQDSVKKEVERLSQRNP